MTEYHANLFELLKAEPLPVQVYDVQVDPIPEKRPLFYKVLGITAKRLTRNLKTPIISDEGQIKVVGNDLSEALLHHRVPIPDIDEFKAELKLSEERESRLSDFDEYKRLVNRIIDVAFVYFSEDFYKYHPNAPHILKKEPTFDSNLIENTGIIDCKEYYRSLRMYHNKPYIIFNRGTQLVSFGNLLNEMKCLLRRFAKIRQKPADSFNFYDPPDAYVDYLNVIFRGKSANVIGYPGPSVRNIHAITWEYRGGDITPGQSLSSCDYLAKYYGIKGLDRNQPLIEYILETPQGSFTQYHVPEVLSVRHDFGDLRKIIPPWQRKKVWDFINPNCKIQMREIFKVMEQVNSNLCLNMPKIYPSKIEISTTPANITDNIVGPEKIDISFLNKDVSLDSPYDEVFYGQYGKSLRFVNPVSRDIKTLVCLEKKKPEIDKFIIALQKEFKRRNRRELIVEYKDLNFKEKNYKRYDLILTISDSDELYKQCKTIIQNEDGILHQNVRPENANSDSLVPLVMQLSIMFRADSWLLTNFDQSLLLVGIYFYRSPFTGNERYFYNMLDGSGKLLFQSPPYSPDHLDAILHEITKSLRGHQRVLFFLSFNQYNFQQSLVQVLEKVENLEYMILLIKNWDNLRIFKTWKPKFTERRRRRIPRHTVRYPFESYENAPQGVILKAGENRYYVVTSRSVRHETGFRGCPMPINVEVFSHRGNFDVNEVLSHTLSLSMMSRTSGHTTRLPSPLNYLHKYAYYIEKFGQPRNDKIQQSLYYL
jgi:hypothetical protein